MAESSLQNDLNKMAPPLGASVRTVDCGTTMCVAELEWRSYADAKNSSKQFAQSHYAMNCARTIFIPPPSDLSESYSAKLVLDCEDLRAESN
jgi:hypothetical protein